MRDRGSSGSAADFYHISLERLHERTSEKWSHYPPDVLPAFVAETDFELAPAVRESLVAAVDASDCGYAHPSAMGEVFSTFALRRFGWAVHADRVFTVPDVMAGVIESVRALSLDGSAVVINPPVYPPFFSTLANARRPIVEVPLVRDDETYRWSLDFAGLERTFAAGAGAYLLCSPHNPVGRVWSADELARVAALAERYSVAVVVDEIHAPLTLPGVTFVPYLVLAGSRHAAVSVTSASKAWNIAGLKCAVVVAGSEETAEKVRAHLATLQTEIRDRIGQLGVIASMAAFADHSGWLDALLAHLDSNRLLLARLLASEFPGARWATPEATYLAWIDCSGLGLGADPAKQFLKRGRVALHRGLDFGAQGASFARLNFGTSSAILTEIVARMARAIIPM
jgi:cystathionine beta-lyase